MMGFISRDTPRKSVQFGMCWGLEKVPEIFFSIAGLDIVLFRQIHIPKNRSGSVFICSSIMIVVNKHNVDINNVLNIKTKWVSTQKKKIVVKKNLGHHLQRKHHENNRPYVVRRLNIQPARGRVTAAIQAMGQIRGQTETRSPPAR